jgi:hypothetical protein
MHIKFKSENLKGRDHTGELSIDGKMILKLILKTQEGKMWIVFN